MKRLTIALMLIASNALACEKGCFEHGITPNQKVCACDEPTQSGDPVKPSDEKPRHEQVPAWQSGEVHVLPEKRAIDNVAQSNESVPLPPNGGVPEYQGKQAAAIQ